MRRVYLEEAVKMLLGRHVCITRRNHARRMLVERCGYTNRTMQILLQEAHRQAGV